MYIGNKRIKNTQILTDDKIKVIMAEGEPFEINTKLFEKIKTEKVGQGNIVDNIRNYFARKFLAELAYNDLDFFFAENIGTGLGVLAHNLREQKISEAFKVSSTDGIKLSKLI